MRLKLVGFCSVLCLLTPLVSLLSVDKIREPARPRDIEITNIGLQPGSARLAKLRSLMESILIEGRRIEAYIIPTNDAHQSEYVGAADKRRSFISGFTGSAGTAVVGRSKALLWTDGRYFTQADLQLDPRDEWTLMKSGMPGTPSPSKWLAENLPAGSVVAADPSVMTSASWLEYERELAQRGHSLAALDKNLVDIVWGAERPARVLNPIVPQAIAFSGRAAGEKSSELFAEMRRQRVDLLLVSALDQVAYLLNWRGSDIEYNPVFYAHVLVVNDRVHIFTAESRIERAALMQLTNEGVAPLIHPYEDVRSFLQNICKSPSIKTAWISAGSSYAFRSDCKGKAIKAEASPVALMKLIKNPTEIQAMRNAHTRDSVALVKFFAWLESTVLANLTVVTEKGADDELLKFRQQQENFVGASFATISAAGPNAAQIHYGDASYAVAITTSGVYLCDSGGQYLDGTTDVTRTFHFGNPTPEEIDAFTRVFKGQTAIATTIFPKKTPGYVLDVLARRSLWAVGLDYRHGTGHGVGSYLNVHEPPVSISQGRIPGDPGLQAGIFTSNEPGYYEVGKFGIRLENVVLVKAMGPEYQKAYGDFLGLDTFTLVPVQRKMLNVQLLTEPEIAYYNKYHEEIYRVLYPLLQGLENQQALSWLYKETRPIGKKCQ